MRHIDHRREVRGRERLAGAIRSDFTILRSAMVRPIATLHTIAAVTTAMPIAAPTIAFAAFARRRRVIGGAAHARLDGFDGGHRRIAAG